jgi:hypothetical protein
LIKGAGEINTHSLLLRAADLLAQNEFIYVLESETFKSTFGKLNEDQVTRLYKKMQNYENCIKKGANHLSNRIMEFERNFRRKTEIWLLWQSLRSKNGKIGLFRPSQRILSRWEA